MIKISCDCCEEIHEETFFCDKCSNQLTGIFGETPDPFWDGIEGDGYEEIEIINSSGDICMNCCDCHLKIK